MSNVIVRMKGIVKGFSGVEILHGVDLTLHEGEVLALLGGNGAGKSTLMKVLSGVHQRDGGTLELYGENITGYYGNRRARKMKVAIIHQELNLCQHMSVEENIFMGRELRHFGQLDKAAMRRETVAVLGTLGIRDLSPDTIVGGLSIARQQMVEIAKALYGKARVLIMDEPSSSLSEAETKELFRIIHDLKAMGTGIIYITHRLAELSNVADTVMIMRDGRVVTEGPFSEFTTEDIIKNMVGREIREQFPREKVPRGGEILRVEGLTGQGFRDIGFTVYKGEVLGFAGLVGAGRSELMRGVFGADPLTSGTVNIFGKPVELRSPEDAIDNGILLVPEDRKKQGLCLNLSIKENMVLPNLELLRSAFGTVKEGASDKLVQKEKQDLAIRMPDPDAPVSRMSGGNQQKVVIGRWLARDSKVIIFDEPTRGIDVGAKHEIYEIINKLKRKGIGVIIVSSEMPEVMGISDRILVMCDGRITGELDPEKTTEEEIMTLATAFEKKISEEA